MRRIFLQRRRVFKGVEIKLNFVWTDRKGRLKTCNIDFQTTFRTLKPQ
ncbi:hypothetical protein NEIMUCOT_04986 [Neisseria mucosa ATCC 25996]|uniref:Uncharacterized protein n=1 Tax=Neisseria mucosa (strain ATCC 25996 / DSM 4631 / NCTC 10774 / M26) TaxID=546266 RepID=D2ZWI9_NEIM2|nr:hypothetical protein NEIMUCOT_04986 [Neisseria mucosa ATCC 25996]